MNTVAFIVARERSSNGPQRFTVFRIRDDQRSIVAHFETLDEAHLAAQRFADKARLAGLDARVVVRK
jgi:hypothetical protein